MNYECFVYISFQTSIAKDISLISIEPCFLLFSHQSSPPTYLERESSVVGELQIHIIILHAHDLIIIVNWLYRIHLVLRLPTDEKTATPGTCKMTPVAPCRKCVAGAVATSGTGWSATPPPMTSADLFEIEMERLPVVHRSFTYCSLIVRLSFICRSLIIHLSCTYRSFIAAVSSPCKS